LTIPTPEAMVLGPFSDAGSIAVPPGRVELKRRCP
jgi:hypothetical protein